MKLVDLARSVGLSVQQVRTYADVGFLPPTDRTESGYRIFTSRHADALAVSRLLIRSYGWGRALAVMRAVHDGRIDDALELVDAAHAELYLERERIQRVLGAFEAIVLDEEVDGEVDGPATMRIGEVARSLGVRTSSLRLWERNGLLRPARDRQTGYRSYERAEQRHAQLVALLRRGGYPIDVIGSVLEEMRTSAHGKPERVRRELARQEAELHRRSRRRLAASAALHGYLERLGTD